jgi:hypothetical protein
MYDPEQVQIDVLNLYIQRFEEVLFKKWSELLARQLPMNMKMKDKLKSSKKLLLPLRRLVPQL